MPLANSLYCCAGGFSTGATQAGHTVKLAVDNSEEALACHTDNHPKTEQLLVELGDATHSTQRATATCTPRGGLRDWREQL